MTESPPPVSVVMPTHNSVSHGFLRPAIDSVLGQTWRNLELIIVDDGSLDGTPDFVRQEYASDARIKLFELEHVNQANARNYGVAHSSGQYIAFLDSDDTWKPEKLERCLLKFEEGPVPFSGLLFHPMDTIDERGTIRKTRAAQTRPLAYTELLEHNPIACSSVVVPKRILENAGPMRLDPPCAEDYDLWLRIAVKHPILCLGEVLGASRVHQGNVSRKTDLMEQAELTVIGERLRLLTNREADRIRARHLSSFARMRFGNNDFAGFQKHYATLRSLGHVDWPLRGRYALSLMPCILRMIRRAP